MSRKYIYICTLSDVPAGYALLSVRVRCVVFSTEEVCTLCYVKASYIHVSRSHILNCGNLKFAFVSSQTLGEGQSYNFMSITSYKVFVWLNSKERNLGQGLYITYQLLNSLDVNRIWLAFINMCHMTLYDVYISGGKTRLFRKKKVNVIPIYASPGH